MSESLYSPSWYRIAELRPRLRSHAQLHRHFYRGEQWYVMQDHSSGRFHRFTPSAYRLIGLMDGKRSIQEIWEIARSSEDEDPPTQEEVLRLLSQLHSVDMLQCNVPPDTAELLDRFEKQKKNQLKMRIGSPFAIRIPLFDPDRFLNKISPFTNLVFSWFGFLIWLLCIGAALTTASLHWAALTENITDRVLAPHNLVLLWLTYQGAARIRACLGG